MSGVRYYWEAFDRWRESVGDGLVTWTIYNRPKDHPIHTVIRPWMTTARDTVAGPAYLCHDIDAARRLIEPLGLVRMEPSPDDDPVIWETWV